MLNKLTLQQKLLYYSLLILLVLIILFPIYYMISISLKLPKDIYRTPSLLPINATLQNYVELFGKMGFLKNIRNSFIVSGAATPEIPLPRLDRASDPLYLSNTRRVALYLAGGDHQSPSFG